MRFSYLAKAIIFTALFASNTTFAQGDVGQMVNRKWYILAMQCPHTIKVGDGDHRIKYMQYYYSIEFTPANYNNINQGTFVKTSTDMDTDPVQHGKYSIRAGEAGLATLVLTDSRNHITTYSFKVLDEHHLTLSRLSDDKQEKCTVSYAIAP